MSKSQKKILIVEDDKSMQKVLSQKLSIEGYEVSVANNGQEGFDLAVDIKPDLILLDIIMPVVDGMTALDMLHNNSVTTTIPVIMLTNLDSKETVIEAQKRGAHDFLIKSNWKINDIIQRIDALLH